MSTRHSTRPWFRFERAVHGLALVVVTAILLTACGEAGGTTDTTDTTAAEDTTTTTENTRGTTPPDTTEADRPADKLADARGAVIRIVAEGTFLDPADGWMTGAGSGSGFIIDPDGIAVTNNHVVTGSALLRVFVEGEDEPRNAQILGVSECYDLAVIDIDGAGDLPYLGWRHTAVEAGMPIFALGFPDGDPEYTVYDGVVSKEHVDGETGWSSAESVIEHSADIIPGNSGGPVIDENTEVAGVTYALNPLGQSFAIGADIATGVVETLRGGDDLDGIGVNGQAWQSEASNLTGIWVASVETASPADDVGIRPGDLIVDMEGLPLATDGTMADYCDILRTRSVDEQLKVMVARLSTGEILEGTLNGPELEVVATIPGGEDEEADEGSDETTEDTRPDIPDGFEWVTDNTGNLEVAVPASWEDRSGDQWTQGEGPGVSAAPDREGFMDRYNVPGVFVGASEKLLQEHGSPEAYLDTFEGYSSGCDDVTTDAYDDGAYVGTYNMWTGCGAAEASILQLVAVPEDRGGHLVYVLAQTVSPEDEEALEVILDTFWTFDF